MLTVCNPPKRQCAHVAASWATVVATLAANPNASIAALATAIGTHHNSSTTAFVRYALRSKWLTEVAGPAPKGKKQPAPAAA